MKKIALITSLFITVFTFNAQAKENNFVMDIKDTPLNGIFTNLSTEAEWPKVAITFLNFTAKNCANLKATIWHSEKRKEVIPSFHVCNKSKGGGGARGAIEFGEIKNQMSIMNNTGNKRTEGPYPPSDPLPFKYHAGIFFDIAKATGFDGSQLETNLWLVNEMR